MTNQDKNILWLDLFDFLTYGKKIKLLETIEKTENLAKEPEVKKTQTANKKKKSGPSVPASTR